MGLVDSQTSTGRKHQQSNAIALNSTCLMHTLNSFRLSLPSHTPAQRRLDEGNVLDGGNVNVAWSDLVVSNQVLFDFSILSPASP
jgi:hypothetical protein